MNKVNVIAISKSLNSSDGLDVYVYEEGNIYLYSKNNLIKIKWDYQDKIHEIAFEVDEGTLEWVDIWITNGQQISRNGSIILLDNKKVKPFKKLSKDEFAKIGPVTSKIFNEFLRSRDIGNEDLRRFTKESFDEGFFTKTIADIMEYVHDYCMEESDLNNLDKQIIIRAKIEGYKFIIDFMKNLLANSNRGDEFCQKFLTRVFMLESQNFIKVDTEKNN